ncbi:IclR family transcriptional regulator [Halomonas sp. HP20-15]|uniref:IclR family transcriptional regulator n=1 Tax=Halomonas sp. HP20-15 TaxID=3085901 RepID=UPI002980DED1|nr:IclR family transcriptional regulator [Halomonas sp. HP20-15]MDW5377766.1 IclR family transcriptional regulator [Halomonas sp. HP20-15]
MDKTLVKGIHVLETIAASDSPMSVSEVAEACGLARSNAHRVLSTFLKLGYLSQDESTRRYRMTLRVWSLGSRLVDRLDFKREALAFLERLNNETGEATHLSVLNGHNVIYIDKLEAKHAVRTFTRIGGIAPAFCVATGRAMLAYQNDETIEDAIAQSTSFTENTITDHEALREELRLTRLRGYAVNRGEWRGGAYGIAVPVFSATNHVIAAIGISAPAERMSDDRIEHLAILLKELGRELSRNLGASNALMAGSSAP